MKLEYYDYFKTQKLDTSAKRSQAVQIMRENGAEEKFLGVTDDQIKAAEAMVLLRTSSGTRMYLQSGAGNSFLLRREVELPEAQAEYDEKSCKSALIEIRDICNERLGDIL